MEYEIVKSKSLTTADITLRRKSDGQKNAIKE
jgi:hypothetical protein